ncbi:hypothetical protein BVI434_1620008 [Burkholderia vietnamiensis]|nr:hypothetical protein BVI434_1620008 [Burkholderia vietnamiensis]
MPCRSRPTVVCELRARRWITRYDSERPTARAAASDAAHRYAPPLALDDAIAPPGETGRIELRGASPRPPRQRPVTPETPRPA